MAATGFYPASGGTPTVTQYHSRAIGTDRLIRQLTDRYGKRWNPTGDADLFRKAKINHPLHLRKMYLARGTRDTVKGCAPSQNSQQSANSRT